MAKLDLVILTHLDADHAEGVLSVVVLIEWRNRRLLFVGDAEWDGELHDGKHNGSWNIMWEKHRRPEERPSVPGDP